MTEKVSFETASKKLDKIIEKLENGNLTLDESVKLFEEASSLLEICEKEFKTAKGKLTVIRNGMEKILDQE